ncbi:cysteine dioxygenase family protein [Falsiroseomonas selenitidurans]|uniref:Cysteine dioxygenase n=1 Tax=Falsiroseomonas selenitidurans TaxID=2716335 RepID=A0ABX1E885_9PROT|nr:cysteine dioxygenase [Falsiroseomonas selenitidurans]NKC33424.1 cysteine dioxygenase [Falsiroseomonas selenitidurans]
MSETSPTPQGAARLRGFIAGMTRLVEAAGTDEPRLLAEGGALLGGLVAVDDWLPDRFAQPHPEHYMQYLLHCDPLQRFSVVSFVWGPGQRTPIHDHTVWGLIGVLRGAEVAELFAPGTATPHATERLEAGMVDAVSPRIGDIHRVANAFDDRTSISIHVYGANIGAVARHVFDAATLAPKGFVSGYANTVLPNPWRG